MATSLKFHVEMGGLKQILNGSQDNASGSGTFENDGAGNGVTSSAMDVEAVNVVQRRSQLVLNLLSSGHNRADTSPVRLWCPGSGAAAAHGSQVQSPWPAASQSPAPGSSGRFLAPVTPLPDYAAMQTPELRDQLQRFGVRRLPRTRAVNVLNRIYDETHPLVPETPPRPPVSSRQEVNAGDGREYRKEQSARNGPSEWFPGSGSADEEPYRYHVSSSSGEDGGSDSSDAGIKEQLGNFFKRNTELLESVLTYEPIDFQKLRLSLKEANIRISSKSLINYLDEQCITFTMPRSEKQQAKQRKRQQNFRRRLLAKQGPSGSAQHSSSSP